MTDKEQTLANLKKLKSFHNGSYGADINRAIKSLEQEPCEDAVSRQEVLDLIADYDLSMGQVVRGIHALPSVTPQPRKGHWVRVTDKEGHLVWKCDKCGWQQRYNTNFCPDCGTDMREVEE